MLKRKGVVPEFAAGVRLGIKDDQQQLDFTSFPPCNNGSSKHRDEDSGVQQLPAMASPLIHRKYRRDNVSAENATAKTFLCADKDMERGEGQNPESREG